MTNDRPKSWLALAGWLALPGLTALAGSAASIRSGDFYLNLDRPAWAPPSWLFGPVWTLLYVLMGIAAWLVWRERDRVAVRGALTLFVVQLVFNGLWTWLFFAWQRGGLAFADVVVLALLVAATAAAFWRVRRLAGALLVPYLGWVLFATALTWAVWQRNPDVL